ncbi:MAG: 30S ribosomal protein S2 [Candidatus Wildermuthbacteria bacterium]|nr:30S ribosomal protein S2 [Candidatus Wildermuthbacteria bacterium]
MAEQATLEQKEENKEQFSLEEMMEAGLHFGHKTSKTHPRMKPYVAGVRNSIHLINLEKTREKLREALEAVRDLAAAGKVILLVGTKVQVKGPVRELAEETGLPYVTNRWIGGLITNFEMVAKRIEHLKALENKKASEDFGKYTKWEQHEMEEERKRLERKFGGVKNLERLPDAMFVFDLDENQLALREAKLKGIQVFALVDTNCDPASVNYAIPANNDAISSVKYIAGKLRDTLLQTKGV